MKKPATLAAIRPNAGIEAAFQKRLDRLIDEMHRSLEYWICAAYKANPPEMAQDSLSSIALTMVVRRLTRRWTKRFNEAAPEIADYFTKAIADRSDRDLQAALRKAGMTVKFQMTPEMSDIMRSTVADQVSLIKSIAQQHLGQVEQLVMRSVAAGRDVGGLQKELQERFGITKRRAKLIAMNQNNVATSNMNRARTLKLGITKAIWKHSGAGKVPRPSHLAADGKEFDLRTGMMLDGEWTFPQGDNVIGCKCQYRAILPRLTDEERESAFALREKAIASRQASSTA